MANGVPFDEAVSACGEWKRGPIRSGGAQDCVHETWSCKIGKRAFQFLHLLVDGVAAKFDQLFGAVKI